MNIFVDESGTFTTTPKAGSWCTVAAYVSPEGDRKKLEDLVNSLRRHRPPSEREVKLKHLPEAAYFDFLAALGQLNGLAFAAATEMSLNSGTAVTTHQQGQALGITAHISKMHHQSARDGMMKLSSDVLALPPQLYLQLTIQCTLFYEVINRSTLYYVQRSPQTLREFRWRVDQKELSITGYERAFRSLLPAMLQSMSIRKPMPRLVGYDYSHMNQYELPLGKAPEFLARDYGLPQMDALDVGKMVRENFAFVDSKAVLGIQVADLLASGFRRFMRGEFTDSSTAAKLLGRLTVQSSKDSFPLSLLSFGETSDVNPVTAEWLKILRANCRPMVLA